VECVGAAVHRQEYAVGHELDEDRIELLARPSAL